jgi:hypothetical protein
MPTEKQGYVSKAAVSFTEEWAESYNAEVWHTPSGMYTLPPLAPKKSGVEPGINTVSLHRSSSDTGGH